MPPDCRKAIADFGPKAGRGSPTLLSTRCFPPRLVFVLVLLSAIAAATARGAAASAAEDPYRPATDETVLERLPGPTDAVRRNLRSLRADLAEDPKNLSRAVNLARKYIELGRAESDPRYDGYAESALRPWASSANPPVEVLVLRAVLRQRRHDFDGAVDDFDRVLTLRPGHAQALLSRAFVLAVQGKFENARKSCEGLPATLAVLIRVACRARMDGATGNAERTYQRLKSAVLSDTEQSGKSWLWALTILAETATLAGRNDVAERRFREALALDVRDVYLLGAYADFLLDRGRVAEAHGLLKRETRADGLLLRLALAEHRLGAPGAEAHIALLRSRFAASRRRGDIRHIREEARFTLHLLQRPAEALRLALRNWQTQREAWDTRLVLEAALAANMPERARAVVAWIEATGNEDATLRNLVERLKQGDI